MPTTVASETTTTSAATAARAAAPKVPNCDPSQLAKNFVSPAAPERSRSSRLLRLDHIPNAQPQRSLVRRRDVLAASADKNSRSTAGRCAHRRTTNNLPNEHSASPNPRGSARHQPNRELIPDTSRSSLSYLNSTTLLNSIFCVALGPSNQGETALRFVLRGASPSVLG